MKKTQKTAMTAALFAAAMNIVPSGAVGSIATAEDDIRQEMAGVYGPPPGWTEEVTEPLEEPVEDIQTDFFGVYGPPSWFTTPVEEMTEPIADPVEEIRTELADVYGPPSWFTTPAEEDVEEETYYDPSQEEIYPVYGPAPSYGDITGDGIVDVFDLVALRQLYVKVSSGEDVYWLDQYKADVNFDDKFTIADFVVLQKYIFGQVDNVIMSEKEIMKDQPVVTAQTSVTKRIETTFTAVYGPPPTTTKTSAITTIPDTTEVTTPTFAPVYGPPPSWSAETHTEAAPFEEN